MKKSITCLVLVILLASLFFGCKTYEEPYTFFRQEHENVAKIELCAYDHKNDIRTPIATITEEQEGALLAELALLRCKTYFPGDHSRSYGRFQICITYTDGELELIGPYNIGYVTANGLACLTNYYPASEQDLWDLISKYVNEDILAQLQ